MSVTLNPRLAKIARITAKVLGGLVAFLLLIVLGLFVVNSFDVSLSPEAKALLTPPPNPYPADDNLYLAIAGMEGAGERPILAMGQERIEAYNKALDSMFSDPDIALNLNKQWDAAKLVFKGKIPLGSQRTTSIWTDVKSHRQEISALLNSNEELYRRYLSLHRLHGYYETARPSFMAPVITPPQPLRILFLADVANRFQMGSSQQRRDALDDLNQDLQLWRTILKGDGTLIGKMLAAAFLHADLILLADLIADPGTDLNSLGDALDPVLLPFDLEDYRIGNAFAAEFRGTAALYKTITFTNVYAVSPSSSWLQRTSNAVQAHFFKINATENLGAQQAARWVALGDSEPSQFLVNSAANRGWIKSNVLHLSPGFIYNPTGKILAAVAVSQNDAYFLRVFDVAAYQRLVYLAYQLKRQHVATADVPAFLKAHPEWSTHPVDDRTFSWNAETDELTVNALGPHPKEQRFSAILR